MPEMRKVRVGVLGAGWWATANHLPVLAARDDVQLTAVCRLGKKELRQAQDRFGFCFATESATELVAHPDLDAVLVTSPHTLHYEHARLALGNGLHVLCEKPFTTQGPHARELVRLAREKNRHLLIAYGWHHKPFIQQARYWLEAGLLGRVEYALCHMASPIRDLLQGKYFDVNQSSGQAGRVLFEPDP